MGWRIALYLGIPTVLSGCNIASYATHNLVNEPAQEINQHKLRQRMNAEARSVWNAECARRPAGTYSRAYADGFIDGYVDHLDNGGTPGPPAAPPPRYRRHASDYTPLGQMAQRDYLTGFQHGAEVAAAGGSRQNVVVAVHLPAPRPDQPLNINCVAAPVVEPPPLMKPPLMLPPTVPGAQRLPEPKTAPPIRSAALGAPQAIGVTPLAPGSDGERVAPVGGLLP